MKIMRLFLIALLFACSVMAYSEVVLSNNSKIYAGMGVNSASITWNSATGNYWTNKDGYLRARAGYDREDTTFTPYDLVSNDASWNVNGRWFVSQDFNKKFITVDTNSLSPYDTKTINNGSLGQDLTQMFTRSGWFVNSEDPQDFRFNGNYDATDYGVSYDGYSSGAGKFCLFRVRVTDVNGANERYYWVGDTSTGSFTYTKSWTEENFRNNPGKGKYGQYAEAIWNISSENIDVRLIISCNYDQARFEVNLINNSTSNKYVSLGMYGVPSTSNNPASTWNYRSFYNYQAFYNEGSLQGWNTSNEENFYEVDPCYFYIPGVGTLSSPTIFSKAGVPDSLEMYSYRYNLTYPETNDTRVGLDNDEGIDSTYNLPPKSSFLNVNQQQNADYTRTPAQDTAFQHVAQATFETYGDTTKPDYLIVDFASTMLDMASDHEGVYPFGLFTENLKYVAMDSGDFPTNTYWPGNETGVASSYENAIYGSRMYAYVDQFTDPFCYMSVWGSKVITPGKSRQIVTYYGVGGKSFINGKLNNTTFTRHNHTLLVEGPSVLGYQVTSDELGSDKLTPNTFTVHATVSNDGWEKNVYDFNITKIKVYLDEGLEMLSGEYKESEESEDEDLNCYFVDKSVLVRMQENAEFSIALGADEIHGGALGYTIKIYGQDKSGGDEWTQEVTRTILVPTTKNGVIYGGPGNLIACPFKNVKVDGQEGDNPFTITDVFGQDSAGFVWNSSTQAYEPISNLNDLRLNPQGFWVLKGVDEDSDSEYSYKYPTFVKPNDINYGDIEEANYYMAEMDFGLNTGWNIISNPYVYPLQWSNVLVKNLYTGDVLSMSDAVDKGWIYKSLFTWEPTKDGNGMVDPAKSKYFSSNTVTTQLVSNKGYWVYATKPLHIYFKPVMYPDAKIYDDEYYTDPDKHFKMGNTTDENYN